MARLDSNTVLLMRTNGTDGGNTFVDISDSGHTLTAVGNAVIDTDNPKFSGALYCDGSGDGLATLTSSDFNFGTDDFTIDFQCLCLEATHRLITGGATSNVEWLIAQHHSDPTKIGLYIYTGTWAPVGMGAVTISDAAYHHIALDRYGDTFTLFVDGAIDIQTTLTDFDWIWNTIVIGGFGGSYNHYGMIEEYRVSLISRYRATAFTPPTQQYSPPPKNKITVYHDVRSSKTSAITSTYGILRETNKSAISLTNTTRGQKKTDIALTSNIRSTNKNSIALNNDVRSYRKSDIATNNDNRGTRKSRLADRHDEFTKHEYAIYIDDAFEGLISGDSEEHTLENITLSDGYHEIEIRPSKWFWRYGDAGVRMAKKMIVNIDGGDAELTLPIIENLRSSRINYTTFLYWNLPNTYNASTVYDFGVWYSATSPVDTSGEPDEILRAWNGAGAYSLPHEQTEAEYVAIACRDSAGTVGTASELYLPWGSALTAPQNQITSGDVKRA